LTRVWMRRTCAPHMIVLGSLTSFAAKAKMTLRWQSGWRFRMWRSI